LKKRGSLLPSPIDSKPSEANCQRTRTGRSGYTAGLILSEPGRYPNRSRPKSGMGIENDYLVTTTGVELLSDYPLELSI